MNAKIICKYRNGSTRTDLFDLDLFNKDENIISFSIFNQCDDNSEYKTEYNHVFYKVRNSWNLIWIMIWDRQVIRTSSTNLTFEKVKTEVEYILNKISTKNNAY
jgi:hypothetical protein